MQSLICMTFIGMVLPAAVIAMFDLGDENRAFPILFAGLFLGLAVLLLCVPVSRGRRISDLFDHYASTDKRRQRECGPDSAAWDESDIESIVEKARKDKNLYENSRWFLGVSISAMAGVWVFQKCGVYHPLAAMWIVIAASIAFLVAIVLCAYSCPGNRPEETKVTNCGQSGQGMKSTKESETSNRSVGTNGTNEVGNGEA